MRTRIVSVRIDNVRLEDRVVREDHFCTFPITSVYCLFWHKDGPDAHIVVEYQRMGRKEEICLKYGRKVKVQRTFP